MPVLIAGKAMLSSPCSSARRSDERYAEASSAASPAPPPRQTGPTAWMTYRAGSRKPGVRRASPVGQPPIAAQARASSGPAARWIARQTPPPGASASFAALTIASVSSVVMSTMVATSSMDLGSGRFPVVARLEAKAMQNVVHHRSQHRAGDHEEDDAREQRVQPRQPFADHRVDPVHRPHA